VLRWFARRLNEARKDERGFTLIELLVVTFGSLRARAEGAELRFEQRLGGRLAYFARF